MAVRDRNQAGPVTALRASTLLSIPGPPGPPGSGGTIPSGTGLVVSVGSVLSILGDGIADQLFGMSHGAVKQYFTLGGDATLASGNLILATSGVTAGTYGDASHVGQFTVDAKGRITSANSISISGLPGGTGLVRVDAGAGSVIADGTADQIFGRNHANTADIFFTLTGDTPIVSGAQYVHAISFDATGAAGAGGSVGVHGTATTLNWLNNAITLQRSGTTLLSLNQDSTNDFISFGSGPHPTTGLIRVPFAISGNIISTRDATNTIDQPVIFCDGSQDYYFGIYNDLSRTMHYGGGVEVIITTGFNVPAIDLSAGSGYCTIIGGTGQGIHFANGFVYQPAWTVMPLYNGTTQLLFESGVTSAVFSQKQATSDVVPAAMAISAQSAFGSAATNKTGGQLSLLSGDSQTGVGHAGWYINGGNNSAIGTIYTRASAIGGNPNDPTSVHVPWSWSVASATLVSGSTTTLTTTQSASPVIAIASITLTGASTLEFPNVAGFWLVDISQIAGLSAANTLSMKSGSTTVVVINTTLTPGQGDDLIVVITTGNNGIRTLGSTASPL